MHTRTNIVLDEQLVKEAFRFAGGVTSKRELIDLALREFIANHKRRNINQLRGKVHLNSGYNYKALREEDGNGRIY
jgi:Arc/MetJ family transcription regulator